MMEAGFRETGILARYEGVSVAPESFETTLTELMAEGVDGFNITMPYKRSAVAIVRSLDSLASRIGAINTVKRTSSGYVGFNTDVRGIVRALDSLGLARGLASAFVLGTGGTARAFAGAMSQLGCPRVQVSARSAARVQSFCAEMNLAFPRVKFVAGPLRGDDQKTITSDLLFNATPVSPPFRAAEALLGTPGRRPIVFDAVYNPIQTGLLQAAEAHGCTVVHGSEMLVQQGAAAFEIWTGRKAPLKPMRTAMMAALEGSLN